MASGMLKNPMRIPLTTPAMQAIENPRRILLRLAKTWLKITPVFNIPHPSKRISLGAGRKRGGIHIIRLTVSQRHKMTMKEMRLSHG
jgi:hypothetical protein